MLEWYTLNVAKNVRCSHPDSSFPDALACWSHMLSQALLLMCVVLKRTCSARMTQRERHLRQLINLLLGFCTFGPALSRVVWVRTGCTWREEARFSARAGCHRCGGAAGPPAAQKHAGYTGGFEALNSNKSESQLSLSMEWRTKSSESGQALSLALIKIIDFDECHSRLVFDAYP